MIVMRWTSQKLRQCFLDYFASYGHAIVASSHLVPENDPTLLFTNAGMVQFKNVFLGRETFQSTRAASSQRCLRAGGKHNDLDEVGYTARHHTFFEMLGNFSFGDYFKREAIQFAWKFITEELKIPKEKLWVTIYLDDDESADIWLNEIGINPGQFSRCGEKDNFWRMGDTGPCGPCTEIFYDHGASIPGGPPGSENQEGDRYVEIWNIVFMQYDQQPKGKLVPLPAPSVDTGMGLERLTAVMQGVHNNYDTDLFQPMIKCAAELAKLDDLSNRSLRVIADHIRASAFLIIDGVQPGNEGRSYVLRRIIRRAIRHGYLLGIDVPFFSQLLEPLVAIMGHAYPELIREKIHIATVIEAEEQQFSKTLSQGMRLLEQVLTDPTTHAIIPGETVFKLYDTYGFPTDLTADIAKERQIEIDWDGFEKEMTQQKQRAKNSSKFSSHYNHFYLIEQKTEFTGYQALSLDTQCLAIYFEGESIQQLLEGQQAILVLQQSPFYPEAGGQVGDTGVIKTQFAEFTVTNTQRQQEAIIHIGVLASGTLSVGDHVEALVDPTYRLSTATNHTATHLLHAALRQILGTQVIQKGSLVAADRLRFDFSYTNPLTCAQIQHIEQWVNQQIRKNYKVETEITSYDQAIERGAMALFGEKYTADVRVLNIGGVSLELCGGTHAKSTGEIGLFKVISETGIAAGIRRIEAVTGQSALDEIQAQSLCIQRICDQLKVPANKIEQKVESLQEQLADSRKIIETLQLQSVLQELSLVQKKAEKIGDIDLLVAKITEVDSKILRQAVTQFLSKKEKCVVVLATVKDEKVNIIVGVSKSLIHQVKAGELVNYIATQVGGKGGGKPDLAQAGGDKPVDLPAALASVSGWLTDICQL